jgi:hypothetical protein
MVKVAIAGTGALAQHLAQASLSLGHEVLLLSRHVRSRFPSLLLIPLTRTRNSPLFFP